MNKKITKLVIYLADDMRCRDEIQLLEGPNLLPCPCPGLAASVANTGFKELLFELPACEYEVEGMFASSKTYENDCRVSIDLFH